jgi:phage shock protein A
MAIFRRIRDIVSASINDLLARVEDPELVVNQMIREMEQSIIVLRRETASAMASLKLLRRRLEKAQADRATWGENAELAVRQERDDLAREALLKRRSTDKTVAGLERQVEEADQLVVRLKDQLSHIEDKVQEARAKRDTLVTKKRLAEHQSELARNARRAADVMGHPVSSYEVIDGFERLEEKIEREVAEVEAMQELDMEARGESVSETFERIKREQDVEAQLRELKKRIEE